ncbi:MAG: hypothetical protein ACRDNJ_07585, partial [Solirubrobacteraceae bacterium]
VVLGARAAGLIADLIAPRQSPSTAPDGPVPPDVPGAADGSVSADVPAPAVAPEDVSRAPFVPPTPAALADEPPAPVARAEPAHVSEEPELVREDADPGAEEGAGAQLRIAEPWAGYRLMKARDVIDRLASATPAELAAIELYERSHRQRKTVVAAAERALRLAVPPGRQAAQPPSP